MNSCINAYIKTGGQCCSPQLFLFFSSIKFSFPAPLSHWRQGRGFCAVEAHHQHSFSCVLERQHLRRRQQTKIAKTPFLPTNKRSPHKKQHNSKKWIPPQVSSKKTTLHTYVALELLGIIGYDGVIREKRNREKKFRGKWPGLAWASG